MEIINDDKISDWKHKLKQLYKTRIGDPNRLGSIKQALEKGKTLYQTDAEYLEEKYQQLQLGESLLDEHQAASKTQEDIDRLFAIIKKLHQRELGDYSRLESIANYLTDGQTLLEEDGMYLQNQYEQLKQVLDSNEDIKSKKILETKSAKEPQTILIDDVEPSPTENFVSLGKTISNIIYESTPHFTIGIYGEWGTGKTTLMKAVENNLKTPDLFEKEQKVLTVWFNAWKHEREDNLATISLMKTVAYAMQNHEKFGPISKTILNGLTIFGKDLMEKISISILSEKKSEDNQDLDEKLDYLNKLYRDSIYFDGLEKIKHQINEIRRKEGKDCRVVIFIDDLDRCSPNKALEVLESIKLFLDFEGFVFVIGLSHKTVTQLISHAYKTTGVKGEDYIKKIIQIPIRIPTWSQEGIIDLIENKITKDLHKEYTDFLSQNSAMVARVVDYNPRQLKRFVNNVIIAFETFAKNKTPEIQFNDIFLAKILKSEWPRFYEEFVRDEYFREMVQWMITKPGELRKYFKYVKMPTDELPEEQKDKRILLLDRLSNKTNGKIGPKQIDILSEFDYDTWIFLDNVQNVLYRIQDWSLVNQVMDVVEEFSYDLPVGSNKSKKQNSVKAENISN